MHNPVNGTTNEVTKVFFKHNGINKMLEYNGNEENAVQMAQDSYKAKNITHTYSFTRFVFMPVGYSSFEVV